MIFAGVLIAVLLDAFLVRLLLLPVLLRLTGSAAWWMPPWLRRLLPDVRFGHGETKRPGGPRVEEPEPASV